MINHTPTWLLGNAISEAAFEHLMYIVALAGADIWAEISIKELSEKVGYQEESVIKVMDSLINIGLITKIDYKGKTIWIINEYSFETGDLPGGKWRPEPDLIIDVFNSYKSELKERPEVDILDIERIRHERSTKPQ